MFFFVVHGCALCVFFLHWTACSICVPRAVAQCFAMVEKASVLFSLARACARFSLLLMSRKCCFFHAVFCASCFSLFFFQCKVFSFQLFQRDAFFLYLLCSLFLEGGFVGGGRGGAIITFSPRLSCCAFKLPVIIFTARASC